MIVDVGSEESCSARCDRQEATRRGGSKTIGPEEQDRSIGWIERDRKSKSRRG